MGRRASNVNLIDDAGRGLSADFSIKHSCKNAILPNKEAILYLENEARLIDLLNVLSEHCEKPAPLMATRSTACQPVGKPYCPTRLQ